MKWEYRQAETLKTAIIPEETTEKPPRPIGENEPRVDAYEKVIGTALFTDDIQFGPGLLYARIKRSPHPHALIKSTDVSQACFELQKNVSGMPSKHYENFVSTTFLLDFF